MTTQLITHQLLISYKLMSLLIDWLCLAICML